MAIECPECSEMIWEGSECVSARIAELENQLEDQRHAWDAMRDAVTFQDHISLVGLDAATCNKFFRVIQDFTPKKKLKADG